MSELNPENKCADLVKSGEVKLPTIQEMFSMQKNLQGFLAGKGKALDLDSASFLEKVKDITVQWRNFNLEISELLERLPYKEWKTYTPEQIAKIQEENPWLEVLFEYVDAFHFFMNIGLNLGIDGDMLAKLYYLKNQENFDRQNSGRY
jgi:dimeric dUTPase (all-alpha-NTP-PPase superfamily)